MDYLEIEGKKQLNRFGIPINDSILLTENVDLTKVPYPCVLKGQILSAHKDMSLLPEYYHHSKGYYHLPEFQNALTVLFLRFLNNPYMHSLSVQDSFTNFFPSNATAPFSWRCAGYFTVFMIPTRFPDSADKTPQTDIPRR